jgi:microsomal dipeptidase-like Zn-dependent dipeptidase
MLRKSWRRIVIMLGALAALAAALGFVAGPGVVESGMNRVASPPPYPVSAAARRLHQSLFVADLHSDTLLWHRDLLERDQRGHVDVPRLRDGGVALQVFSVVTQVPRGQNYNRNTSDSDQITPLAILQRWPTAAWTNLLERARHQAGVLHETAARPGSGVTVIHTAGELDRFTARRQQDSSAIGALLAIEGAPMIQQDVADIDALYDAGFRMVGLTHFLDNALAGSAHGTDKGGLTGLGRAAVRRFEEKGIVVDLAHASPRVIDEVLAVATRPLVVSHTGVNGTCPSTRNLSDEHLRGVARTGGIVGIGYWDAAICGADVAAVARAIQYAAGVAGIEHVALGSDFDGATTTPFDTTGVPLITQALLDTSFSEADIRAIMGGNVLRVLRSTLPR